MPTRRERLEGGLVGLLVGDALGVPYEFRRAARVPPLDQIEFAPPHGYDRAHAKVPVGTYSDDGAHALCLLASLLERGRLDADDLGKRLVRWNDEGYLAVDGDVFDVGIQTGKALQALRQGARAADAGPATERDNGNGSLMRVLPLALWHTGPDADLIADAHLQSRVTHGHVRSQVCCALYCLWVRRILEDGSEPWTAAVATLSEAYAGRAAFTEELAEFTRSDRELGGGGTGYVVDCLHSTRWAVAVGTTFERAVKHAVSLGNDTDTTAAVTGGIAGVRGGIDEIPSRWRDALRGRELVEPLLSALLEHA